MLWMFVSLAVVAVMAIISTNLLVVLTTKSKIVSESAALDLPAGSYDVAMILGAGLFGNSPSPMLKERLDTGLALYKKGTVKKLLVSGDNLTADYNEIRVMRNYLLKNGVSPDDIIEDPSGYRTYASMYRARRVYNIRKMIVVTQTYHLHRAVYAANAFAIDVLGVRAEKRMFGGQILREIRELAARTVAVYDCLVKNKPPLISYSQQGE